MMPEITICHACFEYRKTSFVSRPPAFNSLSCYSIQQDGFYAEKGFPEEYIGYGYGHVDLAGVEPRE
jgi:hypothetical protein